MPESSFRSTPSPARAADGRPVLITQTMVRQSFAPRAAQTCKSDYGTVFAVAGSLRYRGAAALCVEGALRGGAGLVQLATVEPVLSVVLTRTPECCCLPCRADAQGGPQAQDVVAAADLFQGQAHAPVLLAGPGLGASGRALLHPLLERNWQAMVLDADFLNALALFPESEVSLPTNAVLTPHPGEMARLMHTETAAVQADRSGAAVSFAKAHRCVVVLKGSETLVAEPDGTLWRNKTGNPGLARGGSGDVLTGLLAALLAQGFSPAEAARCAVWLHGTAADACAKRLSQQCMLPQDLFCDLAALFTRWESKRIGAEPTKGTK